MTNSIDYLATVFNSTLRQMTPILLVALCAGVCSKVKVFNIALEGTLLTSAFFAFLTQYFLGNIWLTIVVAMLVAMLLTFIMSFCIVRLNGKPMIVGMAINTFSLGFTTFMLSIIFDTKGTVSDMNMGGLPKVTLPIIKDIPILGTMFANLTVVDYAAFLLAIVMYVIMYKTVIGFRLRAIGINHAAASSLGINVARNQIISTTLSGAMIGLAGCLLSLGAVTVFTQNISSARGYIALAANNLCQGHPIGALLSSALFGFTQSLGRVLQNTAIKQQLLECIPYIATIIAMAVYNAIARRRAKAAKL